MVILGIETSCDETSAAIVEDGTRVLSHALASSLDIQQKYGGVVPEVAARKQVEYMIPILQETFSEAQMEFDQIDAIAVTVGPGLMGSLLVGVNTAKTLSYVWKKPLIPINHLVGHIYSAWLDQSSSAPDFPLLALIASGGHTDLVLMQDHQQLSLIGSTRDDAVGEAYDKVARAIGISRYPGGPEIERYAREGDPNAYEFPRPMIDSKDLDFSFSGLKTSVLYAIQKKTDELSEEDQNDLAASFQAAAIEVLVTKTLRAAQLNQVNSLLVTGGVSANQALRQQMQVQVQSELPKVTYHVPPIQLATDNATYIAGAGYFLAETALQPNLHLDQIFLLEPNPSLGVTGKV